MTYDLLLRERGVHRVIVGVPEGETDAIRARLETSNGDVITLAEATLSALVQAYMDVFTHPSRQAIELRADLSDEQEQQAMAPRLVEVAAEEGALRQALADGPSGQQESPAGDNDETTATALPPKLKAAKNVTGHLSIDDGPVFGDVATQHSRPAPTDPDLSVEEPGPEPSDDDKA